MRNRKFYALLIPIFKLFDVKYLEFLTSIFKIPKTNRCWKGSEVKSLLNIV